MLDGLDAIAWSDRTHAFGEASDLPGLLRAVDGGGAAADEAISELFNTIWHQGTVYDATAVAVPFLAELATSARLTVGQRKLLLALLFAIGRGKGYWQVHADPMARLGSEPEDLPAVLAAEHAAVADCRAAVASESAGLLARIAEFPSSLWLSVAALVLVAGESVPTSAVIQTRPELPAFGAAAVEAILQLRSAGRMPAGSVERLARLDHDLDDYLHHGRVGPVEDVVVDDDFVDVLVERLCDSEGRGSATPR